MSNLIVGNAAREYGGGIYCEWESNPVVTNNTFLDSHAGIGGSATIRRWLWYVFLC